ncbi:PXA domain-containing protein [Desarmillaria tabescens]|uniref:PXA domain-containing protein n=1 Tax=Armillaria tabescens TaxID=1929756 RepID=A0AA39NGT3_ARMTA|nr:PXA domain-containing protein [Desarmillaria tabescens]KAK0465361.1 PXA domain-containing protein [Desarmillaria tabescens]
MSRKPLASLQSNRSNTQRQHQQPVSLARRLLFPSLPNNDLPLLLVSPVPPELTAELYDFIALALRAFVNPWWTKITRYDKEFLPDITRILTAVVRALEERVLATDFPSVICRDIPVILTQHYTDYRNASSKIATAYAAGGALSMDQLFHQFQPHMALSPDGQLDRDYIRQILDHILKACLPSEDFEPEAERLIVREIILKIVVKDVIPKIVQPWFIQKTILDFLGPQPGSASSIATSESPPPSQSSQAFSFHTILIVFLSAIQSISGACLALIHTYKHAVNTIKLVNQSPSKSVHPSPSSKSTSSSSPVLLETIPSPPFSRAPSKSSSTSSLPPAPLSPSDFPTPPSVPTNRNEHLHEYYAHAPILMISEIFSLHDRYASSVIVTTISMLASFFTPFLDRLLPYLLGKILSPALLLNIVRTGKRTLFPNGYPAPPPVDPTPEEQAEIYAKLIAWRGKGGLSHLIPILLGSDPSVTLKSAIDPLTSTSCNVHLVMMILDRIVIALFPELGGAGSGESL